MFSHESLIMLTDGREKPIGDLHAGDNILFMFDLRNEHRYCKLINVDEQDGGALTIWGKTFNRERKLIVDIQQEFPTIRGDRTFENVHKSELLYAFDLSLFAITGGLNKPPITKSFINLTVSHNCLVIVDQLFFNLKGGRINHV